MKFNVERHNDKQVTITPPFPFFQKTFPTEELVTDKIGQFPVEYLKTRKENKMTKRNLAKIVSKYGDNKEYVIFNMWETVLEMLDTEWMSKTYPNIRWVIVDNHMVKQPQMEYENVIHEPCPKYFLSKLWMWPAHGFSGGPVLGPDLRRQWDDNDITSHYTFMNGRNRPQRLKLWEWMEQDDLINEYCTFLYYGIQSPHDPFRLPESYSILHKCKPSDEYMRWYENVLIDLHVETHTSFPRLTEKGWRPMLCEKISFGFSGSGYYMNLKKLGIKLHEDIIDYSFDTELDVWKRLEMFYVEFKKLLQIPLDELKEMTRDVRVYNRNECLRMLAEDELTYTSPIQNWRKEAGEGISWNAYAGWDWTQPFFNLVQLETKEFLKYGRVLEESERETIYYG